MKLCFIYIIFLQIKKYKKRCQNINNIFIKIIHKNSKQKFKNSEYSFNKKIILIII